MKKIALLLFCSLFLMMCTTKRSTTTSRSTDSTTSGAAGEPEILVRDNFRAATDAQKAALLTELKATGEGYSVMMLTKNFKGESITVSSGSKKFYTGYPLTNLGNGLAERFRVENGADITVYDSRTKKEAVLKADDVKKYKFIYISKNPSAANPFVVTYSNRLAVYK
jgi:hypothetical protein